MDTLSERNETLLRMGAKTCGSFTEGYYYVEEELYVDEAVELREFCEFIDNKVGGAGRGNIHQLFKAFKNPKDPLLQKFVADTKARIDEIKKLSR